MSCPLVSIVMPVYNRAWIVAEAIESVLALDMADWELVLVDDGSTDATPQILQDYAANYPGRVCVVTHTGRVNRGIAASRNLGVASCCGRYVAFLDSDDVYATHRFKWSIDWLEANPQFLGCVEPYQTEHMAQDSSAKVELHLTAVQSNDFGWLRAMLFHSTYWNMPVITLRRTVFQTHGGFDECIPVGEEVALWLKLGISCAIGIAQGFMPVATVRRHNQNSWSTVARARDRELYLHIIFDTLKWLRRSAVHSVVPLQMVQEKLRSYLIEILVDSNFNRVFKLQTWFLCILKLPILAMDRKVTFNLLRAIIGLRLWV